MDTNALNKVKKIYFMKDMLKGYGLHDEEAEVTSQNIVNGFRRIPEAVANEIRPYMPNQN